MTTVSGQPTAGVAYQPLGTAQPVGGGLPQPSAPATGWDWSWLGGLQNIPDYLRDWWYNYGWLGRIGQPLQQLAYGAERGLGAVEERLPETAAAGAVAAPMLLRSTLAGKLVDPRKNVENYLNEKEQYFGYLDTLPEETRDIVNRETRRIIYSGYGARLGAAQDIVNAGDYSQEAITAALKPHEDHASELLGQIILDPLNFAGFVFKTLGVGKGAREAARLAEYMDEVPVVAHVADELPELSGIARLKESWLTPLSKSLRDQGSMITIMSRIASQADDADEALDMLKTFGTPGGLRLGKTVGFGREVATHLRQVDFDALETVQRIAAGEPVTVKALLDDVFDATSKVADMTYGVGPMSALEKWNARLKSIIGVPLISMNPAVAARNISNAVFTGTWDEGTPYLEEVIKGAGEVIGRPRTIERFFREAMGFTDEEIELVFRGFGKATEVPGVEGFIGKVALPGRVMRHMEKVQGAMSYKGGFLKTWGPVWNKVVESSVLRTLPAETLQKLGPHADDFISLIRHSYPNELSAKAQAFLDAIESPEAVGKPLAAYVDQLAPGEAKHWDEMFALWQREGLEFEGKSLDEILNMIGDMRGRTAASTAAKVAQDAPEVARAGEELFDDLGMVYGREEWIEQLIEGDFRKVPPFVVDERNYWIFPEYVTHYEQLFGVPSKIRTKLVGEAAEFGYVEGGRWISRPETIGKLTWGGLSDRGRIHYWNGLIEWATQKGLADDLGNLGFRAVSLDEAARSILDPLQRLNQISGFDAIPTLGRVARVQQKATDSILNQLEQIVRADFQKPRGITADVMPWVDKEVLPAMYDTRVGASKVAELIRDDAVLNYSRRFRFDPWFEAVFPYHFWFDRSAANWMRRIMLEPAKAATYFKLRNHILAIDRDLPTRLQGTLPFAIDEILPNWAVNMIFVNPEQGIVPFPTLFREEVGETPEGRPRYYARPEEKLTPFGSWYERNIEANVPMYTNPLIQYGLGLTGALGEPRQWISGPQTPPTRWIRALSSTGWGRDIANRLMGGLFGGEVPPTGINIEAPLLRAAGIEELPIWEQEYWPLKHIALMAERGEITEDEAVEAMRAKSGPLWEEAQRRTSYQKAWPLLTMGTAQIQPAGEPEVGAARAAQFEAPTYKEYREYFGRHPGIGLTNLAWQMAGGEGYEDEVEQWLGWYDYRQYKKEMDAATDEYIRDHPGDTAGLSDFREALNEGRPIIPDDIVKRNWKMTGEEWNAELREIMVWRVWPSHPNYEDFEQYGYDQYDMWKAAEDEFYRQVETGDAPFMQEMIDEAMAAEGGLSPEDAKAYVISHLGGREGIERQFREYDTILEAAQNIYRNNYIDMAYQKRDEFYEPWDAWKKAEEAAGFDGDALDALWDQYWTLPENTGQRSGFLGQHPEMLAQLEFKAQYQAEHPGAIWENVEARVALIDQAFGPVDATAFIPEILDEYEERGWTEAELLEELGGYAMAGVGGMAYPDVIAPFDSEIQQVLSEYDLPGGYEPVVASIIMLESNGNANAVNKKSGAAGLMQVMPFHFEEGEDPKDPLTNIRRGVGVLVENINATGDLQQALYNYSGGDAWESFDRYVESYWQPFMEQYREFAGAGVQFAGLKSLTFPGFAAYRDMREQATTAISEEAPTAQGVIAEPALGEPQVGGWAQPSAPWLKTQTGGWGGQPIEYDRWWDRSVLGSRFNWRP